MKKTLPTTTFYYQHNLCIRSQPTRQRQHQTVGSRQLYLSERWLCGDYISFGCSSLCQCPQGLDTRTWRLCVLHCQEWRWRGEAWQAVRYIVYVQSPGRWSVIMCINEIEPFTDRMEGKLFILLAWVLVDIKLLSDDVNVLQLLTVLPRENCLALVYRDAETLTFTKYINHRVRELGGTDPSYQTLSGVYYEWWEPLSGFVWWYRLWQSSLDTQYIYCMEG